MAPHPRHPILIPLLALALMLGLVACGDDDEREGTQPAPDAATFEQGDFDDLPLLPRTEPFGTRSEQDGIVAQSYRVDGVLPTGVIDFYERELPPAGWEQVEPAYRADSEARADWIGGDLRLEVSATRVDDRQNAAATEVVSQYSLVLRPA